MEKIPEVKPPFYKKKLFLIFALVIFAVAAVGSVLYLRSQQATKIAPMTDEERERVASIYIRRHRDEPWDKSLMHFKAENFTKQDWIYLMQHYSKENRKKIFTEADIYDEEKMKELIYYGNYKETILVDALYLEGLCRIGKLDDKVASIDKILSSFKGQNVLSIFNIACVCLLPKLIELNLLELDQSWVFIENAINNQFISDEEIIALQFKEVLKQHERYRAMYLAFGRERTDLFKNILPESFAKEWILHLHIYLFQQEFASISEKQDRMLDFLFKRMETISAKQLKTLHDQIDEMAPQMKKRFLKLIKKKGMNKFRKEE